MKEEMGGEGEGQNTTAYTVKTYKITKFVSTIPATLTGIKECLKSESIGKIISPRLAYIMNIRQSGPYLKGEIRCSGRVSISCPDETKLIMKTLETYYPCLSILGRLLCDLY